MTVSLYCSVSGIAMSYVWEMRSTDGGSWSRISNSNNYKYDVRNIQQSKQYRCVAGNDAGSVTSKAATIQILSELFDLKITYSILLIVEITSHPHNQQVSIGSNFSLTCTLSISSHVTFLWIHNGTISDVSNTLTISNVSYSDGGSYVCIVKRRSLSITSNTATIIVYGKLNCVNNHY